MRALSARCRPKGKEAKEKMYEVSSKKGMRHAIDAPLPDNDTVLRYWKGLDAPLAVCGRRIDPVNFYEHGEEKRAQYRCGGCYPANTGGKSE